MRCTMKNADNFSSVEEAMDDFDHPTSKEGVQSEQDKVCYQKFLDGDKEAFEQLVIKHKDHLIYFIT